MLNNNYLTLTIFLMPELLSVELFLRVPKAQKLNLAARATYISSILLSGII